MPASLGKWVDFTQAAAPYPLICHFLINFHFPFEINTHFLGKAQQIGSLHNLSGSQNVSQHSQCFKKQKPVFATS